MMELTNETLVHKIHEYEDIKRDLEIAVNQVQADCPHDCIAEYPCSPPIRICLHCGITEEGWGCGFILLKNKTELGVPSIDRANFVHLMQGFYLRQEDKGRLLRNEVTIAQLILDDDIEE